MTRRDFLQKASAGAVALSLPCSAALLKATGMGVVVHSYATRWNSKVTSRQYPGFANALELLEHCAQSGAGGVQVVVNDWAPAFTRQFRDRREKLGLYLEGSVGLPKKPGDVAAFERDVRAASEAGARVLRTVSLGGRRYETFRSLADWQAFRKSAVLALQLAEPVLRRHGVRLGVENHKDWRADELAALLNAIGSEYVGATIDFGNSIALLEDPLAVVQTLAPFVVSSHIKDMGVEEYADGFLLAEVPLGKGILDLPKLVALCRQHNPEVAFNLEMITRDPLRIPCFREEYWTTFPDVAGGELARMMRYVRQHPPATALPRVSSLSAEEKLSVEEQNIRDCLAYSRTSLAFR